MFQANRLRPLSGNKDYMTKYTDWKNWDSDKFGQFTIEQNIYYKKIVSKFSNVKEVLEIGYGNGNFLGWCKQKNINIYGIETDIDLLRRAKKNKFSVFNSIERIKSKKFDLIVLFDVLEHIPQNKIINFMKQLNCLLKINGHIVIRVPNGSSPFGLSNQHGDITHITIVSATKLTYWSKLSQLKIIYCGSDFTPIYNGNFIKTPSRLLKKVLYVASEKLVRYIFSPQSKGILSANLLCFMKKDFT
jgi:2-polyprenyl-3-methyl-5-hydroxy-6-metoxy-1,4-benzoquinol methylase